MRKLAILSKGARPILECKTNLLRCFGHNIHGLGALCTAADKPTTTMQKLAQCTMDAAPRAKCFADDCLFLRVRVQTLTAKPARAPFELVAHFCG